MMRPIRRCDEHPALPRRTQKIEAVKHITERGLRVADVAERLGVSAHSLYAWLKRYSKPQAQRQQVDDQQAELRRLRANSSE